MGGNFLPPGATFCWAVEVRPLLMPYLLRPLIEIQYIIMIIYITPPSYGQPVEFLIKSQSQLFVSLYLNVYREVIRITY